MNLSKGASKWRSFGVVLVVLNILLIVAVVLLVRQNQDLKATITDAAKPVKFLRQGERVPSFKATSIGGQEITAVNYDGSSIKHLLFIFSTTCSACAQNLEIWNQLALQYPRVRILGVSLQDEAYTVPFVLQHSLNFPVVFTTDKKFNQAYKVRYIPCTVLVDQNGIVIDSWTNILSQKDQDTLRILLSNS